jgi:hypothetical protein
MDMVEVFAEFYSPRWGQSDTYSFKFSMEKLEIAHGARHCAAIWSEVTDPTWIGEPRVGTMKNDSIYPPDGIEGLLEHLWTAWRDGELNNDQLQAELTAFAEYVNASTNAKPKTEFWNGIF